MAWSFRRWRPRHLLLSWLGYWLGLAAVTLGPAVPAILRATSGDAKGSLTGSMGDGGISLTIAEAGATTWSGTASLTATVLWIVGPPLLLWLVWFVRRDRGVAPSASPNAPALSEGDAPAADIRQRHATYVRPTPPN